VVRVFWMATNPKRQRREEERGTGNVVPHRATLFIPDPTVVVHRPSRAARSFSADKNESGMSHKSAAEADRLVSKYLDSPLAVLLSTQESVRTGIEIGRFVINWWY
jgi:hypothetical protein